MYGWMAGLCRCVCRRGAAKEQRSGSTATDDTGGKSFTAPAGSEERGLFPVLAFLFRSHRQINPLIVFCLRQLGSVVANATGRRSQRSRRNRSARLSVVNNKLRSAHHSEHNQARGCIKQASVQNRSNTITRLPLDILPLAPISAAVPPRSAFSDS